MAQQQPHQQSHDPAPPAAAVAAAAVAGIKFQDYDLTLTDRELDQFLAFMEEQSTGAGACLISTNTDGLPQLPDVAMDFPGLQLQPHRSSTLCRLRVMQA